jgi:hypothetical protein
VGRRSRQREASKGESGNFGRTTLRERAERANSVAEKRIRERPKAPWDPFPLTELAILAGIVLMVAGILVGEQLGKGLMAAGVTLACIGGLETALREHFAGYRAHSGLLASILALLALGISASVFNADVAIQAGLGVGVFAIAFPALRGAFIRRSGGHGVL